MTVRKTKSHPFFVSDLSYDTKKVFSFFNRSLFRSPFFPHLNGLKFVFLLRAGQLYFESVHYEMKAPLEANRYKIAMNASGCEVEGGTNAISDVVLFLLLLCCREF